MQKVLTVPPSMMGWSGGSRCSKVKWNWLFVCSFDVLTGKSVCGFRSGRGWSGWIGTWTMSTCRRVIKANVGRFSYVLKVKKMMFTNTVLRQKQLCDKDHETREMQPSDSSDSSDWQLCDKEHEMGC